jgi:hypothetical protein
MQIVRIQKEIALFFLLLCYGLNLDLGELLLG